MENHLTDLSRINSLEQARDYILNLLEEKDILLEKVRELLNRLDHAERREENISSKLLYNEITGLPNHRKMDSDIGPLLWGFFNLSNPPQISVILIKLDENFDRCRQTFNNDVFNNILYTISNRLKELLNHKGLLYHPRTEEFAVFIFDSLQPDSLREIADEILKSVERVIEGNIYKVKVGANVGIASFPDDGLNKKILLSNADMALKQAIQRSLPIIFFNEEMRNTVIGNIEMQNNLLSAMEVRNESILSDRFTLFFQPIISVSRLESDRIMVDKIKAEVLIRWCDENRGSHLPQNLIEVAEETGLILPIGRWLIKSAMEQLREWQEKFPNLQLSINISPRQFFHKRFAEDLSELLNETGANSSDIFLEITETCLFDDQDHAVNEIERLNDMGFRISLDDFGTGYSSLGYLNRFRAQVLKIDKVFTEGLQAEGKKRDVIQSIVRIGKELNMDVVFEGIENLNQLKSAIKLGCSTFQGYLFSRPLKMEDFYSFLNNTSDGIISLNGTEN